MGANVGYQGYHDLIIYQKSYQAALQIFEITKLFPTEEKYSLIDQIRRSSRSVPANIAEAWKKRKYTKLFISKLIECSGEAAETEVWLEFCKDLKYLSVEKYQVLILLYEEISKMLHAMINCPEKFTF
jgi:four helix bundle protein